MTVTEFLILVAAGLAGVLFAIRYHNRKVAQAVEKAQAQAASSGRVTAQGLGGTGPWKPN